MIGLIDNGQRLPVDLPAFFIGTAGVRLFGDGGELSCFADVPYDATNLVGKVGGRSVLVLAVRKSALAGKMVVARFRFTDGGTA